MSHGIEIMIMRSYLSISISYQSVHVHSLRFLKKATSYIPHQKKKKKKKKQPPKKKKKKKNELLPLNILKYVLELFSIFVYVHVSKFTYTYDSPKPISSFISTTTTT